MKSFKDYMTERCWPGYKPAPGKKAYDKGSCVKEEVEQIDEISSKLAGEYYSAATKQHIKKVGIKPNMYGRIEKDMGKQRKAGVDRALDRVTGVRKTNESAEQLDEYESKGGVYKHTAKYEPQEDETKFRKMHTAGSYLNKSRTSETDRNMEVKWGKSGLSKAQSKKTLMNVHKNLPEAYEPDDGPLTDEQLEQLEEVAAWQRKEGKSESGGLNRKGIESYRRENPGSKLSMAVTTKPSKLKPGSKAANRRKSFCARMGGMKRRLTSAKTARDPDSRINKALRKWNC